MGLKGVEREEPKNEEEAIFEQREKDREIEEGKKRDGWFYFG